MSVRAVLFWDLDGTLLLTGAGRRLRVRGGARGGDAASAPTSRSSPRPGMTDAGVAEARARARAATRATRRRSTAVLAVLRAPAARRACPGGRAACSTGVREVLEDLEATRRRPLVPAHREHAGGRRAPSSPTTASTAFFPDGEGAFCIDHGSRVEIARRALPLADGAEPAYVIGDTPADVECGKAIGARTIAVASGSYSLRAARATDPGWRLERIPEPDAFRAPAR